ncbi:prenyltransferase [Algiphilus sp.]|uniref:prenyltransferase n=1 Tax=Algiphilus sp. TaxID=1872431 RepID=UPI003B52207D
MLLTPVCVALGLAAGPDFPDAAVAALILLGGLAAHAAVNTLNEYQDFRSGLDQRTIRTPFSGGSGALPAHPEAAPAVAILAMVLLGLTTGIGALLLAHAGWLLLLPGVLGFALIVAYTRWLNRSPLLCLLAPGIGFGPVMVVGSSIAATGNASLTAWCASLLPLFLGSGLLLLNQLPDIEADRASGRRHLAIHYGAAASAHVYAALMFAALGSLLVGVGGGLLPMHSLVALLPFPLAWPAWQAARQHGQRIGQARPGALGANVALTLLAPALLAISLCLG